MITPSLKFGHVYGPCARNLTSQDRTRLLQNPAIRELGSFHRSYNQPAPHVDYYVTTNEDEFIRRKAQAHIDDANELFESLVDRADPY